jgi:hypothetical protein
MHPCPRCDHQCSCDIDDVHWEEAPDDCRHQCPPDDDDAGYALPGEFDDDDQDHDFTEEELVQ